MFSVVDGPAQRSLVARGITVGGDTIRLALRADRAGLHHWRVLNRARTAPTMAILRRIAADALDARWIPDTADKNGLWIPRKEYAHVTGDILMMVEVATLTMHFDPLTGSVTRVPLLRTSVVRQSDNGGMVAGSAGPRRSPEHEGSVGKADTDG